MLAGLTGQEIRVDLSSIHIQSNKRGPEESAGIWRNESWANRVRYMPESSTGGGTAPRQQHRWWNSRGLGAAGQRGAALEAPPRQRQQWRFWRVLRSRRHLAVP